MFKIIRSLNVDTNQLLPLSEKNNNVITNFSILRNSIQLDDFIDILITNIDKIFYHQSLHFN